MDWLPKFNLVSLMISPTGPMNGYGGKTMPSAAELPAAAATLLASSLASSRLVGFIFQLPPVIGCLAARAVACLTGAAGATRALAGAEKASAATNADVFMTARATTACLVQLEEPASSSKVTRRRRGHKSRDFELGCERVERAYASSRHVLWRSPTALAVE